MGKNKSSTYAKCKVHQTHFIVMLSGDNIIALGQLKLFLLQNLTSNMHKNLKKIIFVFFFVGGRSREKTENPKWALS